MRRQLWSNVFLAVLLSVSFAPSTWAKRAQPENHGPSQATADTADVVFPVNHGCTFQLGNNRANVLAFTEEEFDAATVENPNRAIIFLQMANAKNVAGNDFRQEVSVLVVVVENDAGSTQSFTLQETNLYGLVRSGLKIPSLGVTPRKVSAMPGHYVCAFILFPKMEFRADDLFYITFR